MDIPVYLIAGFLDAGKTSFINGILQDGFAAEDRTLLLCCEEGETAYDPKVLGNVFTYTIDEPEQMTPELFKKLEKQYRPAGHHRVQRYVADRAAVPGGAARQLDPVSDHVSGRRQHL